MSKRTASEAEDDTVANVAEVVWGFITGRVNESDTDYLVENMSEMDKVRHYEILKRTDKWAAHRFTQHVGDIVYIYVQGVLKGKSVTIRREYKVTRSLHDDLYSKAALTTDEIEFYMHVRAAFPAGFSPRTYVKIASFTESDGSFQSAITKTVWWIHLEYQLESMNQRKARHDTQ